MVRTSLCFVDDEPGILKALERMVHPLRIPAVFFPRAAPALDYLATEDPCVIVSDFKMPGMKGVEFLERSRELRPFAARILLTGFAELEAAVDAINRGSVYRFFFKPWDDSVLLQAVHDGAVSCFTDRLLNALPDAQSRLLLAESLPQAMEAASAIFDAAGLTVGSGLEAADPVSGIVAASGLDALFNFTDPMGGDTVAASEKLRSRCLNLIGLVVNDYHASVVRIGLEDRLRLFSERDALSGLYNRRFFDENLRREFDRSRRYDSSFSLLLFDIDHFKSINDTYGHGAGDAVITGVGDLLLKEIRSSDFACRYGGDEFCVIAPELSIAQCEDFARRIAAAFASEGETGAFPCPVSLSIGVADYTPSDGEPEDVLRRADAAMYSVKRGGRNGVARAET